MGRLIYDRVEMELIISGSRTAATNFIICVWEDGVGVLNVNKNKCETSGLKKFNLTKILREASSGRDIKTKFDPLYLGFL